MNYDAAQTLEAMGFKLGLTTAVLIDGNYLHGA